MSDECEHLQVKTEPDLLAGMCRCQSCGKEMKLYEGYNCLLDAMRKRIDEQIVSSMVIHNNRLYVASDKGVFILEDTYLKKLPLITLED